MAEVRVEPYNFILVALGFEITEEKAKEHKMIKR